MLRKNQHIIAGVLRVCDYNRNKKIEKEKICNETHRTA